MMATNHPPSPGCVAPLKLVAAWRPVPLWTSLLLCVVRLDDAVWPSGIYAQLIVKPSGTMWSTLLSWYTLARDSTQLDSKLVAMSHIG